MDQITVAGFDVHEVEAGRLCGAGGRLIAIDQLIQFRVRDHDRVIVRIDAEPSI